MTTPLTLTDLQNQQGVRDVKVVHKFGRANVGTTFVPVSWSTPYQMPTSATTLRVKAGNANDTAAGSGAREVTLQGLDENGNEVKEAIATAGASASSNSSNSFIRLYRAWVSASGTYGDATNKSHAADVVIENSGGGTDWLTIDSTDYARAQSEIACYTVPLGKKAYLGRVFAQVDSNKSVNVFFFRRNNILTTSAPVEAVRGGLSLAGVQGQLNFNTETLLGPYPELTDIGFMAKVGTGTGDIAIDFEIILVEGVS